MSGIIEHFIPQANAAVDAAAFGRVLDPVIKNVVNPIIQILFAVGIFMFAWGVAEMIMKADDATARDEGKRHMLWGAVGMFIMVSAWGIVYLVSNTIKGI